MQTNNENTPVSLQNIALAPQRYAQEVSAGETQNNLDTQNDLIDKKPKDITKMPEFLVKQQQNPVENNSNSTQYEKSSPTQNPEKKQPILSSKLYFSCVILNSYIPFAVFLGSQMIFNTMSNHIQYIYKWEDDQFSLFFGLVQSLNALGALFGSYSAGYAVKYGIRKSLVVANMLFIIGSLFTIIRSNPCLFIGRLIQGFSIGSMYVFAQIYIKELSPNALMGTIGAGFGFAPSMGLFIATCLGYGLPSDEKDADNWYWRFMLMFFAIFAFINSIMYMFVIKFEPISQIVSSDQEDNSPATNTNQQKSLKSLSRIFTKQYIDDQVQSIADLKQVEKKASKDESAKEEEVTLKAMFSKRYLRRFMIGIALQTFFAFCLVNPISAFSVLIMQESESKSTALTYSVFMTIADLLATAFNFFSMSYFGRKTLILSSMLIISICLAVLPILDYSDAGQGIKFILVLYKFAFGCYIGPLSLHCSDILPGKGIGYTWSFNWCLTLITYQLFPWMIFETSLEFRGTFIIFAAFCFLIFIVQSLMIKETKDKTPAQIDLLFGYDTNVKQTQDLNSSLNKEIQIGSNKQIEQTAASSAQQVKSITSIKKPAQNA